MKMNEYKDYMRLLFDKYLSKIFYTFIFLIFVVLLVVITRKWDMLNIEIYHGFEYMYDNNSDIRELSNALLFTPLAYYTVRFSIVYLPEKIYSLIYNLVNIIKKDVNKIQEKHNPKDKDHNSDDIKNLSEEI